MERVTAEVQRLLAGRNFESLDEVNALVEKHITGRPIDEIPSSATTPLERAQDLVYEAYDASGRRQLRLAREAVALSPDCADAYVLLAERAWDPGEAERLYREALAASPRALGPLIDEEMGNLWMHVGARVYLRAHVGLAELFGDQDRVGEAIELYGRTLRLDKNDHQGARFAFLVLLLEKKRDDDARELLAAFDDEVQAIWHYGRALSLYRAGDLQAAEAALTVALRANRHVPAYLKDADEMPPAGSGSFALGSREEAAYAAFELMDAWDETPGALEWLERATRRGAKGKRPKKRR
jgi:tetratricopeptide (TPR) repeat protein